MWRKKNENADLYEFPFALKKMSTTEGALFDMDKLIHCAVRPERCRECDKRSMCESYKGYCLLDDSIRGQVSEIRCTRLQTKRENIQRGCMHLYRICKDLLLPCQRMVWCLDDKGEWNGENKGIDDYYVALRRSEPQ